jgi:hypothetical protein
MKKISLILFCFIFYSGVFSQAVNIDFEASSPGTYSTSNAVSGWTLSSQTATCSNSNSWTPGSPEFSILATPIISVPNIGTISGSPLGGNNLARLNYTSANSSRTKLAQTFSVNSSNAVLCFAFATVLEGDFSHICCEATGYSMLFKDQAGNVMSCYTFSSTANPGCMPVGMTYTSTQGVSWTNWVVKYYDLSPFVNSIITLEVISTDCAYSDHFGTLFFDAQLYNQYSALLGNTSTSFTNTPPSSPVSYCAGSNIAQISAPLGYLSYQWIAPGAGTIATPQGTMQTLTISNPVANSIYTVQVQNFTGCTISFTYALVTSSVNIAAIGTSSTCPNAAYGSAIVAANGSGTGYSYTWLSSTNTIVTTNSLIIGLSPGMYTVNLAALGSSSATCGNAQAGFTIGIRPPTFYSLAKPFCGNEAYLSALNGSNFQWYNGTASISASQGGNASTYTVTSATTGSIYRLRYVSTNGCIDSLAYTLVAVTPGSINVIYNPIICPGATNGTAVILTPSLTGHVNGPFSYQVLSTGSTSPTYSASFLLNTSNTYTAPNLVVGGTYSVNVFDGSCKYSRSFSVTSIPLSFTLNPSNSPTVCHGSSIAASVSFTSPPSLSQYTYSWYPSSFLTGTNFINTIISPTTSLGTYSTIIYTVVVTSTLGNCTQSKTLAITVARPQTPTIVPIPTLCANATNYSINVNPPGGTFVNGTSNSINSSGILSPTLASLGLNTFTYANSIGTCVAKTSSSFVIIGPTLNITAINNTSIFCGESVTLSASGANTYSWSNAALTSSITVTPLNTSTYYVTGTNTTSLCGKISSVQITVLPSPTLNLLISGSNTVCSGNSNTLSVNGANTYTWNNGSVGPNLIVSPTVTSNYTVIGTAVNGCTNLAVTSQTVLLNPTLTISGNYTICPGRESFLAAYGASTYTWSNGSQSQFLTLSPSETTTYSVIGIDYQGCSSTKTVTIVVEGCVGVNEFYSSDLEIKIYPNPSSGNVFLETEHTVQISIFDALGKLISQKELEKGMHRIDLSDYNSGVYLLKITNSKNQKILKILKTND